MFKQYFKNNILYLSEKTSFDLIDSLYKIKFIYLNNIYIGIIFKYDNECKIYTNDRIFNLNDIIIIKILNEFKLYDGAQIKFKYKQKNLKGYIHYFDPSFFINYTNILVIDYYNYDKTYLIDFCDIISNDFTII